MTHPARVRILRYGAHALLVECADLSEVTALYAELVRRREVDELPAASDIVPAERTVLIDGLDNPTALAALAADLPTWQLNTAATNTPLALGEPGRAIDIPVHYDAPDLAEVAAAWDVPESEVAMIHSAHEYRVAFCGFTPGFAYLVGLPETYHLPRRSTPRVSVPAGSVAVAGPYTGVYPRSSPGGWHLIGTTDADLWDLTRDEPALLKPGSTVRFIPVTLSTNRAW